MAKDIIAEIVSSEDTADGVRVVVRTEKLSPVSSARSARLRARAAAIVEAGVADTVLSVFARGMDIKRLTSVESETVVDSSWPEKRRYTIMVRR